MAYFILLLLWQTLMNVKSRTLQVILVVMWGMVDVKTLMVPITVHANQATPCSPRMASMVSTQHLERQAWTSGISMPLTEHVSVCIIQIDKYGIAYPSMLEYKWNNNDMVSNISSLSSGIESHFPESVPNADYSPSWTRFYYQDNVTITCRLGYVIEGTTADHTITLQANEYGNWSEALPNCTRKIVLIQCISH